VLSGDNQGSIVICLQHSGNFWEITPLNYGVKFIYANTPNSVCKPGMMGLCEDKNLEPLPDIPDDAVTAETFIIKKLKQAEPA